MKQKEPAIVVDIDRTLALHQNRSPFEYDKCNTDLPNTPIVDIVQRYLAEDGITVIFLSGREDSCKDKTVAWIEKYLEYTPGLLFMRKAGDFRKDSIIKKEIYEEHIKPYYNILFVLDDRNQVVQMWREQGLTCLQVADGDF